MKRIFSLLFSVILLSQPTLLFAEDLTSTNYKINGATLNAGGEATTSGTGTYKLLDTIGDFSGDPRVSSTNYQSSVGEVVIFTAEVPKVSCFETTTSGSSSCTTGPSYLNTNGMITVCGPSGCYDRARFEIDNQGNPSDTLYAVQISTDNFVTDTRYIDGVSNTPKAASSADIDDYLTETAWEGPDVNIEGLIANTQYYLRLVALHGDFTESAPSPSVNATTALPTLTFDIDIDDVGGGSSETNPPFEVEFIADSLLIQNGPTRTAENLIWLDANTNGLGGCAILFKGQYGGLFSATQNYTIVSETTDLDGESEGFGIQKYSTTQLYTGANGALYEILAISPYDGTGNNVGIIDQVFTKVFDSSGPLHSGRVSTLLKARASTSATPDTDYTETITIVMVPRY